MLDIAQQDQRLALIIEATNRLKQGDYHLEVPTMPQDAIGRLAESLHELAQTLEHQYQEIRRLNLITTYINAGLLLDEILDNVYEGFREFIPYNRIGFSLLEEQGQIVRARWARSDQPVIKLGRGYSAKMAGSSLQRILETGQPRIINDLTAYLSHKPESDSTRLIVEEGYRSSLTCPLIANGVAVGFMFFSSRQPNAYKNVHVETFQRIAEQLSVMVEKGRLVSELADQKMAIERQNAELRRLNELKNAFLGMAAHDLRNPLSSIVMTIDLVTSLSLPPEEARELLLDVNSQTSHMLALINDLLDVSQIESGKLELNWQPVDLVVALQETVRRHQTLAAPKGTAIVLTEIPAGIVAADRERLRQILDNLLSNAVKYSPPGSTIRVSATRTPEAWKIAVQDQGPGITEEDRKRLFQDFARLSARPTSAEKSTGLGLAISRRIVEAHGGQIGVESIPGQGATFWFTLPA